MHYSFRYLGIPKRLIPFFILALSIYIPAYSQALSCAVPSFWREVKNFTSVIDDRAQGSEREYKISELKKAIQDSEGKAKLKELRWEHT